MIEDDEETLSAQNSKLKKSINKSVSFNAIKNLAFDIFSTESDIDCIMDRLSQLFLINNLVVRKWRELIVIRYLIFVHSTTREELENMCFKFKISFQYHCISTFFAK